MNRELRGFADYFGLAVRGLRLGIPQQYFCNSRLYFWERHRTRGVNPGIESRGLRGAYV